MALRASLIQRCPSARIACKSFFSFHGLSFRPIFIQEACSQAIRISAIPFLKLLCLLVIDTLVMFVFFLLFDNLVLLEY